MASRKPHPAELRERAVAMVFELRAETGNARGSIARVGHRLGINTETLRDWVPKAEVSSLTYVGDELSWVRLAGHGAIRLEAVLGSAGETVKPVASAMLLPPVAGLPMHGRPDGVACLWLHIEPRGPDGSAAPPANLAAWHHRLRHAISLATRFTEFLAGDLGSATHDAPAARVGVLLNTAPMAQLVDADPLRILPGAIHSSQFLGYAIADPAEQPARDIARTMLAQLCEYHLHLEDFDSDLAAL